MSCKITPPESVGDVLDLMVGQTVRIGIANLCKSADVCNFATVLVEEVSDDEIVVSVDKKYRFSDPMFFHVLQGLEIRDNKRIMTFLKKDVDAIRYKSIQVTR